MVGNASALLFTLESYDIALHQSGDGLLLNYRKELPQPYDFNLELDVPQTVSLFDIWTNESDVGFDDFSHKAITVTLNFSAPYEFGGDMDGDTYGVKNTKTVVIWNKSVEIWNEQYGQLVWDSPFTFAFGPSGDGELEASLSNESFNYGWYGLNEGKCKGAEVELTLTYKKPALVPEPASFLLMGTGLLGLAGFSRKRIKRS